jgi:hypothetical protein
MPPPPEVFAEIEEVTKRAQGGDHAVVPRLRELLDQYPAIWQYSGDMASHAMMNWIVLTAGSNLYLRESLSWKAEALRRELAGQNPSQAIQLLADRVVVTWLMVHYFDASEPASIKNQNASKLAAFRAKRQNQAHRAHLTALASLTALSKLIAASSEARGSHTRTPPQLKQPFDLLNRVTPFFAGAAQKHCTRSMGEEARTAGSAN